VIRTKKFYIFIFSLLIAACAINTVAPAANTSTAPVSPSPSPTQQDLVTRLTDAIEASVQNHLFQGGSVLAGIDGKIILSQGFGWADQEKKIANTALTRFRLGSVTKQFTAMAIMMLQERQKLDTQERVCQYLPDCPDSWKEITIHHLLTHTAGIPNFTALSGYTTTWATPSTPLETMARFRDRPLLFEPGDKFSYSNSGYIVLGYLIEIVSGLSYEAFLQENIFTPLHMADSGYDHNQGDLPVGYNNFGAPAAYIDMSIPYAAGGLFSTVADLYQWDQALYTEKLLSQELLSWMWTPHVNETSTVQYGYGWEISFQNGHQKIYHAGGVNGFTAYIVRYPAEKITVIILSNHENTNTFSLGDQLAGVLLEGR